MNDAFTSRSPGRFAPASSIAASVMLAGGIAGCAQLAFLEAPVHARPLGDQSTMRGPAFDSARDVSRPPDPATDWAAYNNQPSGMRYSPLQEISAANAASLHVVCTFPIGDRVTMQAGPVVVNGTMYVTTVTETIALDAATCALRWRHMYKYSPGPRFDLGVNRGVAFMDGRLFRGANDGRLYALDARTGKELWNVVVGDPTRGESFPAAPIAWRGRVFIGNAGGDNYGVTGRMMAFDAATGGRVWSTDLVPNDGPASQSWPAAQELRPRAGGASWTSYTLDTATGLVYVPVGNAAPDFFEAQRPGANLYSYSLVAIDAATGTVSRAYQLLPHDFHDWDVAAAPALVTTAAGHNLLIEGGKDGHVYGVDIMTGAVRYRTEITTVANVDAPITPAGTRFCPGVNGGVEWNGAAYSPITNAVYVNSTDWCSTVKIVASDHVAGKRGLPWTGSPELTHPFGVYDKERSGWLSAVDADDGSIRWRYHAPLPIVAGVTTTAGGITVTGDLAGNFLVFDAAHGNVDFQYQTHQPIGGGVVSYAVAGHQYLAVASGMNSPLTWQLKSTPATIIIFALPH